MSTAAPEGEEYWPARRRHRYRWLTRLLAVAIVLGLLGGAGYGVWHYVLEPTTRDQAGTTPTKTTCSSAKHGPKPLSPRAVRVDVLNHTSRTGLAGATARTLQGIGFKVGRIANDTVQRPVKGPVELRAGRHTRRQVALLKEFFPGASVHRSAARQPRVVIVLGKTFGRVRTVSQVQADRKAARCS